MSAPANVRVPRATYRLQLTPNFGFAAAEGLLDYFSELGISDLYLSPIFTAAPGSAHGYDVADYTTLNEELGGRAAFERLCDAAASRQMGLVLDFIPNHMGVGGGNNAWWRDVLLHGRSSRYADFFDIQWYREGDTENPRVLLPVLKTHFGKVVEAGELRLVFESGHLQLAYHDTRLPVNVRGHAQVLSTLPGSRSNCVDFIALESRTGATPAERATFCADAEQCARELSERVAADTEFATQWSEAIGRFNQPPYQELALLADHQHYRLARWKAGIHEINYRRFFAISTLVGIRIEDPAVFAAVHATLAELLRHPAITGLRIDHIDGLRDPAQYLGRLQALAVRVRGQPIYLVVEKILNGNETLPPAWPVHGTTGYEFIPQLAGLLVDPSARTAFTACYEKRTGDLASFTETTVARKEQIMQELFPDIVGMLGWQLSDLVNDDPRWRDFSRHELTTALLLLIAHLAVYRTYRAMGEVPSAADRAVIDEAAASAIAANPRADPKPIDFIRTLLRGDYPEEKAPGEFRDRVEHWVATWQQYTGAIMAKSVEDTAFYTSVCFVALNEVGGDPAQFGTALEAFHEANQQRLIHFPHSLLTTSTHDTKVSEDVRARLYALSEFSPEWPQWVGQWETAGRRHVTSVQGVESPDARDRYRLYQILIGVWPISSASVDENFRERVREHLRKAVSEAKRHTSDVSPNESYLAAGDRFVEGLTGAGADDFLTAFLPAARQIAAVGALASVAQVILKASAPGIPDFYQGNETWDFSLVDPDNRRPVDFATRRSLLEVVREAAPEVLLRDWESGALKLFVTRRLLEMRRECPDVFRVGDYCPLDVLGPEDVAAFSRHAAALGVVVILPRRFRDVSGQTRRDSFVATTVTLPRASNGWRDILTGRVLRPEGTVSLAELFAVFPFSVLRVNP